jgi:hypothetical protein
MVSDFAGAISDMALAWAGFLQGISDSVAGVPLLEDALKGVAGAASRRARVDVEAGRFKGNVVVEVDLAVRPGVGVCRA